MDKDRASLIRVLRSAYSGELAAGFAYRGHWKSIRSSPEIRERIQQIEREEWHHRSLVGDMLAQLNVKPRMVREAIFWVIGRGIGALCHIGGRFIPMYGAGRLEESNIREYETAAKYAHNAGLDNLIDCILTMAEVEWEHERFFREQVAGHWLLRVFPMWPQPPAKESIRREPTAGTPRRSPAEIAASRFQSASALPPASKGSRSPSSPG